MVKERMLLQWDRLRIRERRERSAANRDHSADTGRFFENEIWLLLDVMGFEELNPSGFRLDATPEGYGQQMKQIDVFAKWQKEVLVIECKASDQEKVGLDRRDLSDFQEKRPRLVRAIYEAFGRDSQVNFIVWLKGITPISRDLEDISRYKMSLLDYDDFLAYQRTAKIVGSAAKFQLFADLYGPRRQTIRWFRRVPAISGKLGGYPFYYFMVDPQKLLPLANVPRRRPHGERVPGEIERVKILYQRMLIPRKLKEIARYVQLQKGFFPNGLVVSFLERPNFRTNEVYHQQGLKSGLLSLPSEYGSVTIIDGQHRLFGYSNVQDGNHLIPVLAFESLDSNEQGDLFVTINSKQKKVDSNILWDLHEYFGGSMKGAISRVVKELNRRDTSPLHNKVVIPSETRKIGLPLKMTALCTGIESAGILPLLNDDKDEFDDGDIQRAADLIAWYFADIRDFDEKTKNDWEAGRRGYLCTNNGVSSFLFLLDAILRNVKARLAINSATASLRIASGSQIETAIRELIRPALTYVSGLSQDERDALRKSSSKGQQVLFAAELEAKIAERVADFQLVHMKGVVRFPATKFEGLVQELVKVVLKNELGAHWFREGIHKEERQAMASIISKKGHDPNEMSDEEKLNYSDLGMLQEIIKRRYVRFQPIFGVDSQVFAHQMSWINAYRSGQASVHTGDTEQYLSMMGRGAMGQYTILIEKYLKTLPIPTATQQAQRGSTP